MLVASDILKNLQSFLLLSQQQIDFVPMHVSLYAAILVNCRQQEYAEIVQVTRKKLMGLSAIKSNSSYHRCLNDLVRLDIIEYQPSFHPRSGSRIRILQL